MNKELVIFGTYEIAKLAKYYFGHDSDYEVAAFIVDDSYCESHAFEKLPLIHWGMLKIDPDLYPVNRT